MLKENLNEAEQLLFLNMSLPDQRHALNVAQTALELAAGREEIDKVLLLRCALLHDVGRQKSDVSIADKIFTVLLHKFAARFALAWGKEGRGGALQNLRHAVYVYFNHPALSADLLRAAAVEERAVLIVSRHHKAPTAEEPPELALLRQADGLN